MAIEMKKTGNPPVENSLPIKVRFNHEDIELPYEEAVCNIQKGLNYDKVAERLSMLQNDEALKIIDGIASEFGVSRAEITRKWKTDLEEQKIMRFAEEKGLPPDMAMEVLQARKENEEREFEKRIEAAQEAVINLLTEQESEFHEAYPDLPDDDVPDDVLMEWGKGTPLKHAYQAYENPILRQKLKEMEDRLSVSELNGKNEEASMGSVRSNGDTQPPDLTAEGIKQMTSEQRRKYMPEILKAVRAGKLRA